MSKKTSLKLEHRKRSIPDETLERAKAMYMDFLTVSEIARELNVNRTTIQYYVKEYWKDERNIAASDFLSDMAKGRATELSRIQRSSLAVIRRSLSAIAHRAEPPTTKEALDASKILENMDKLAKADPSEYGYKPEDDALELDVIDPFAVEGDTDVEESND